MKDKTNKDKKEKKEMVTRPDFKALVDSVDGLLALVRDSKLSERHAIGKEFWKWFYDDGSEVIEDAIERITGVPDPDEPKERNRTKKILPKVRKDN